MSKSTLYLKDKTLDQDQKKETRNKIIIGSAVVAGSIFAYKSGALRPMVNLGISMLERSKGAVASTGAFVNWFNSEGQEGSGSVLRKSIGDTAKNIINAKISGDDINISINKDNLNKIIKDTKADFFDLKDRVASAKRSAHNNGKSIMSSLFNTDMMKDINDSDHSTKHYSQNHRRAKEVINYKTKQDLIRSGRLSQKDIDKQLKRMGMRNLTIEDIFDFDYDSYGDGRVKLTVKSGRKNSEFGTDSDLNKLIGKLEGTLNAKAYSDGGTRLMKDNKGMFLHQTESSFGKMKVDSSLFINGKGKITDLRGTKRGFNSMLRGAANNWKIPIININPLKMAGLGNIGTNRNVKYATIGETQVAPFLTGVSGTGKDKTIAALKKTQGHLSGIKEGVTLINGDVYRIDDSGRGITKMAYETKKRVSYVSGYGSKNHNYGGKLNSYVRTMAGASKTRYEEHTNGKENKFWRRMMRKLDIGYQDTNRKTFNTAADYINPDNYVRALTKKLIPKAWNKSKTEGLYTFTNPMSNDVNKGSYFVSNQSVRIRDIFANVKPGGADLKNVKNRADLKNELSKINVNWRGAGKAMSGYVRQFGAGFDGGKNSFEYVNKKTALAFSPFKMVNDKLSNLGLGLSASSSRSSWDLAKNLLLKRALPAYALYRGWDLINMLGEKDRSRKATTVNQVLWEQVAATDIGFHTMSSKIGLNKFASGAKALMPGSNTMFRNIGVGGFRMDQNADERLDYWENGYDPVRKNRFMTLSSGPMGGGSIEYFRANPYRRALADAKYSEQGYGSRAERLANTLNPYHYDKKHYYDRPYLQTSGAFGSVPIVGGMLQGTIGRLVKPVKKMHSEYWKGPFNSRPLNSIEAMRKEMKSEYGYGGMTYIQSLNSLSKVGNFRDSMSRQYDMERASGLLRFYGSKKGSDNFIYRTPSGYMNRAQVGNNFTQYNVNNGMTLSRAGGSTRQVLGNEIDREAIRQYRLGKISKPSAFSSFSQFKKSTGMYGFMGDFMAQPVYSGRAKRTVIESSNYRSMRQSFDDMRLGNLGGDFNMLARRTLQGRRNDTNYYNPIRNRMSDWMPGRNGFIDFQHGDAFCVSKDTLILTKRGYIKAYEVKDDDIILSHKGRELPIKERIKRPILNDEKSYSISVSGIDSKISLEFSEEHPILVKRIHKCSFGSSCLCRPDVRNLNGFCDSKNCKRSWNNTNPEFVKVKDVSIGDAVMFPIPINDNIVSFINYSYEWRDSSRSKPYTVNKSIELNKDISWILGLYMAEGCVISNNRIQFALHKDELEVINKVASILSRMTNNKIALVTRGNCTEIILCDAKVARMFKYIMPGNLYEKRVPNEMYYTSKDNMISFILGFMLGDGTVQRNFIIGTSANKDLILDLHKLCFYCGIPSNISYGNTRAIYELSIHHMHLRDIDTSLMLYKNKKINKTFNRTPNVCSWSDGEYIYSLITDKKEIKLDFVYGFEVDVDDTFCVIGFATHNTKVANGLERLPGEGFERLNNIDFNEELKLKLDASNIGKSKNELVRHWTKEDTIDAAGGRNIAANRLIKQSLMNNGVGIDSNVEISDNNKISGTYDLRINDSSSSTGQGIVNIRAVDAENFKKIYKTGSANKEDVAQVNWLLGATNPNHKGYVMYVNRENPGQQHTIGFNYDENMNRQNVQNVLTARKEVINKLNTGDIKRGDFYSYVNRLKVLADVAPYSEEYQAMSSTVSNMKLSQAEQEEVRKIRARVKEQKKSNNEMFGYKFRDAKVQSSRTRLGKHIGRGSFTIKGYGDALKLSGIDIITTDNPKYAEAQEFLRKNVENNAVKILIEKENHRRRNKDMQDSVKAVVYSNGMNINKEMVKRGYATWKDDDNSSTATYARFNRGQRAFGRAWERFAHMDTLAHTKLLNVRSAAEAYERDEVYGRKRKSWTRPVRDYVKPFLWKNSQRGLLGLAIGGAVGSMFAGKGAGRFGKLAAATIGAGLIGATQAQAARSPKGKAWIPKEKQQIRDINQYMDKLKYVKHKRLFELYSAKAKKYDKVDVKKALIDSRKQGSKDKRSKRHLKQMKAHYSRYGKIRRSDMRKAGIKLQKGEGFFSRLGSAVFKNFKRSGYSEGLNGELQFRLGGPLSSKNILDNMSKSRKERDAAIMKRVNGDYTALMNKRELTKGSQNAIKAIEHYNEAKKTMHAFEPGDNMKLAMEALPKKDRAYFKEFMNASGRERKQIMKYAPDYMKRQLQSAWGQKVDEADNLSDYFSQHALPDNNWEGWNEGYDLNSIKTKMAITNNIDLGDLDLYEDDKAKAEMYGNTDIPNIYHQNKNSRYIKSQLKDIMGSANFYDVDVNISYIKGKSSVNLDIEEKKEERFKKKLDKRLRDLR